MATKFLAAALLAITFYLGGGCASEYVGPGSGAGAVVYSNGNLTGREYSTYNDGWNAALGAMSNLGYAVTEQQKDVVEGTITARAPGDKKITVKVLKVSGTLTEFRIRVGTWGDKAESEQIFDTIKKRL